MDDPDVTTPSTPGAALRVDEALSWIAEMFEEPPANVRADTHREHLPAWDSLGQLVLMSALDQRFGIRLTQEELAALASVQDILNILARYGRLESGR
jgi:acyl carrier protein